MSIRVRGAPRRGDRAARPREGGACQLAVGTGVCAGVGSAATVAVLGALARPGGDVFISTINRNFKSFALAIVGAEYLARLVPRGTHEYDRLLKPSEIARFARAAGLDVADIAGLEYDPLREQCTLTRDPSVNYLVHLRRHAVAS